MTSHPMHKLTLHIHTIASD